MLDHRLKDMGEGQVGEIAVGGEEGEPRAIRRADNDRVVGDAHALGVASCAGGVHDERETLRTSRARRGRLLGPGLDECLEVHERDIGLAEGLGGGRVDLAERLELYHILDRRARTDDAGDALELCSLDDHHCHVRMVGFVLDDVVTERVVDRDARQALRKACERAHRPLDRVLAVHAEARLWREAKAGDAGADGENLLVGCLVRDELEGPELTVLFFLPLAHAVGCGE
mmetsp:Transcript_66758/g.132303  ORF Transcript_66758/g.132303 Transcript_66758/m.132303 type:complete len:229 (+) Transcript_66758:1527-2213(+)